LADPSVRSVVEEALDDGVKLGGSRRWLWGLLEERP
jgi:hypothetical protein